jgi:hypothetical protein
LKIAGFCSYSTLAILSMQEDAKSLTIDAPSPQADHLLGTGPLVFRNAGLAAEQLDLRFETSRRVPGNIIWPQATAIPIAVRAAAEILLIARNDCG